MTTSRWPSPEGRRVATQSARVAAAALYVQVVAMAIFILVDVVDTVRGETDDVTRAVMLNVTIALLGLFVALVARFLARGAYGARVPAIVWDLFLLPVGWNILRTGHPLWGLPVLAVALVVIVGCLLDLRARPGA